MSRDIDRLSTELQDTYRGITIVKSRVADAGAEDDGLWLVNHPDALTEVQVKSGTGDMPFLVQSELASPTIAKTIADATRLVGERLGLRRRTR